MARILIIDDDDIIRSVMGQILTAKGHEVATAGDGHEGMRSFRQAPADLVITDMVMPNQEGMATIMELRKSHPKLGIIAMSGGTMNSGIYLTLAGRLGAMRTLAKPFPAETLLKCVDEVLAICRADEGGSPQP